MSQTRIIKFRVWNGEKMYNDPSIVFEEGCYSYSINTTLNDPNPDIVFMQFTGLKDKNGVEIYEGDIVRVDVHYNRDGRIYRNYVIEYKQGGLFTPIGLVFSPLSKHPDYIEMGTQEKEVIGNIYATPELLNN